ncbi:Uncharacterized protein OS=Maribacter sp. (strain HTCC2170 / KCCM 42371) GN=FB2170_02085 PE=4 SV=1: Metallophos_2 [Gemmata massiliana]|uniref:Calcineurin-like phosphoesterase domain-containing protein n=1 Tax=Gemmata massiliana TaxID=1210884 RepID=A0A6P2DIJ0_9BACT|nr:metallophosphoesterase [Gemmata massiliana]VTS02825.1 Uncharacterized protein OS=Maribacter sp. (strain HTCC2170 / KCCM 42371) GN=FB2170_02085 PE=4 SV=1: Metallophos_2 [Gemmata massiliana]
MDTFARTSRRQFLYGAGCIAAGCSAPAPQQTDQPTQTAVRPTTIGLIADPHHGLAPDADKRLGAFMAEVTDRKPDFIMQLGDFCHPARAVKSAASFLRTFEAFPGPRYHVVGNHDLDLARSKREVLDGWGVKEAFYSFEHGGFHFAVLDCNFVKKADGRITDWASGDRYENRIHPDQLDWLAADLAGTKLPTVLVSHQGFGPKGEGGVVPNADDIRAVIDAANARPGGSRVVLCLHGHNHLDRARVVSGVHFVELNSASYLWVGEKYGRMAPYQESLFAFLTLDPRGTIRLSGRASAFSDPTPKERGYPDADQVTARITDRELTFTPPQAG